MFPQAAAFLLALACASVSATGNGTAQVRTFGRFPVTDERLDWDVLLSNGAGAGERNRSAGAHNGSVARRREISDAAVAFLTGPVSTVLIPSFYTLVCAVSVPINICAAVAFVRRIRPKKPAAIYMLNLACADLLFAALLPFKISYHFGGNNWVFGDAMCRLVTAAFYWNMYCSVLLIMCISVDRLLAVVYPIDSLAWRRPRRAAAACAAMWALSFAGAVPLVLSRQTLHLRELNITTCHDVQDLDDLVWRYKIYFIALCCAVFFLPLLVTVASYARVIWSLSAVPRGVPGRSRRRSRAVLMAATVLVTFVLCFTPTNCLLLAHYAQFRGDARASRDLPEGSYAAYLVFMCVGSLSCLLDPVLYYFGSSQCQRQLAVALSCRKAAGRVHAGSRGSHSLSDSYGSGGRRILKSSSTETSQISGAKTAGSLQGGLGSQYKKLLV